MDSNCSRELHRLMEMWLGFKEGQNLSPRTLSTYQQRAEHFIRYVDGFGLQTPEDVKPAHIVIYSNYLRELGLSDESVYDLVKTARIFWNWLFKMELVERNPFTKVDLPRRTLKVKQALSIEQIQALLDACGTDWIGKRNRAVISVLVDTGLRASELLSMKVSDAKQGRFIIRGKGARERMVVLSKQAQVEITRYLKSLPEDLNDNDYLWRSPKGRITLFGLHQALAKLGKRAGVEVSPHALRRTAATMMLRNGASLEAVRVLLGHADYSVLRRYLSLSTDDIAKQHEEYSPLKQIKGRR